MTQDIMITQREKLETVIEQRLIYPVYQPIVSLRDGKVLGYEALSRVSSSGLFDNIEEMFRCAEREEKIWELEQVCRRAALREIAEQKEYFDGQKARLFINVNPKVLRDEKFQAGFTGEYLERYGIKSECVIFEITERQETENEEEIKAAVEHYRKQGYHIAIDDVGSAYSGLNRICALMPEYIKLDIGLVRDFYKEPAKLAMIKGLVEFSTHSGVLLIAEGIECRQELDMLAEIGVQFGQGYFLARPDKKLRGINEELRRDMEERGRQRHEMEIANEESSCIKGIMIPSFTVPSDANAENVLSYIKENEDVPGLCVVEKGRATGILTREKLLEKMGGRYGFALHHNKQISELVEKRFLEVEGKTAINNVVEQALERERENLYDFIVINDNGRYVGVVTVQNLLKGSMKIAVNQAKSANPLTGLPGNKVIEQKIRHCITDQEKHTIFYFDLDNFKAFNDVYGFGKGDEVIRILADILRQNAGQEDFVGHIGGDDFVMICKGIIPIVFHEKIRTEFEKRAHTLYTEEDRRRGGTFAMNRHGVKEFYPLVSVTIVAVSNEAGPFGSYENVTEILAADKKAAKAQNRFVS